MSRVEQLTERQNLQFVSSIAAVSKPRHILGPILRLRERMVTSRQTALQIPQNRVHPIEPRQSEGFQRTHHHSLMNAVGLRHRCRTSQRIAEHRRSEGEMDVLPLADRRRGVASHRRELDVTGVTLGIHRHRRHKRHLVLRAPCRLAARTLLTQMGVVYLNESMQQVAVIAISPHAHQLVVPQLSGRIAETQMPLQSQGRQSGLSVGHQVRTEEPQSQGQLGVLGRGSRDQRGLMPSAVALEHLARTALQNAVRRRITARTHKAVEQARQLKGGGTARFGAKAGEKFGHRHTTLILDSVHGHDALPVIVKTPIYKLTSSPREPLETSCPSGSALISYTVFSLT